MAWPLVWLERLRKKILRTGDRIFPKEFLESMWTNWQAHTFAHILIKETLKGTPPFLYSEFSGVHSIYPTCYRYILQSLYWHCKGTPFLMFLLKILKDYDNLMALGTRSHIFGPRNKMDSMPCLTEFTLHLFDMSFRQKLYGRETGTSISFKMDGENPYKLCKFL